MHHHIDTETTIFAVDSVFSQLLLAIPFLIVFCLYMLAVTISNKRHKQWPKHRIVLFTVGVLLAIVSVAGPLAVRAHEDFTVHMVAHLLMGMLAPLLIALAAPMTLVLRSLQVDHARKLSKWLKSWPARIFTNPFFTAFMNVGGLWLLYTTNLFSIMHESFFLYVFIHFHLFMAGYLLTISILYIDPIAHRYSYIVRASALLIALAGHGILSKYIYANPPAGVPRDEAELGGMMMYYGGDFIDAILIFLLCYHWYKAFRPRRDVAHE